MAPVELAAVLQAGERAAFHGRPADGVAPLRQALTTELETAQAGLVRWLLGICLGATGEYAQAWSVLSPTYEAPVATPAERLIASLAAACAASLHRQLGDHDTAAELDEKGLAWATPLGRPGTEAVLDCGIGLVADAVGDGDLDEARRRLESVEALVADAGADVRWRARVRLAWVRAEVALLSDDASGAVAAASGAVELAEAASAPRHVVKSQLFLGVAQSAAGQAEAPGTLRAAASSAGSLGLLPLVWPSRAVLGAVLGAGEESEACLEEARSVVEALSRRLPPDVADKWLIRPEIVALRQV